MKSNTERKQGWYWVLLSEGSDWDVAKYECGKFYHAFWGWVYENELLEIGAFISRQPERAVSHEG